MDNNAQRSNTLQLILGTGAFALCFAVFGSVSAMMPVLKKQFHLAPVEASIAMAIPVLLGSLGRIPLGLLTDRFGGRRVFTGTMLFSVAAAVLMGKVNSYPQQATEFQELDLARPERFEPIPLTLFRSLAPYS